MDKIVGVKRRKKKQNSWGSQEKIEPQYRWGLLSHDCSTRHGNVFLFAV